ncbi:MAG: heavy-metal-associated domain-containing protein [Nitrospina sp.]|nr:heavy-metal-associated domain-containing protein [Nitrospina sp.]
MKKVLQVEGMTCQHCVQTVSEAVGKMAGIENVEVKLDQKEVIVEFDESKSSLNEIASQITEAGFEIIKD